VTAFDGFRKMAAAAAPPAPAGELRALSREDIERAFGRPLPYGRRPEPEMVSPQEYARRLDRFIVYGVPMSVPSRLPWPL
jgi:hypothetical protein